METINRKVIFTLEGANIKNFEKPGMMDYESDSEREFATKQRTGILQTWGTTPNGDNVLTCGIVEDCEDGQVYCVPPSNIRYVK